jgi:hypothetical protein
MNGFLVVLQCPVDDIPAGLYATREEAEARAKWLAEDEQWDAAIDAFEATAKRGVSDPPGSIAIVEFVGGVVVKWDVVATLDGDDGE